jgi:hypothetical protein
VDLNRYYLNHQLLRHHRLHYLCLFLNFLQSFLVRDLQVVYYLNHHYLELMDLNHLHRQSRHLSLLV